MGEAKKGQLTQCPLDVGHAGPRIHGCAVQLACNAFLKLLTDNSVCEITGSADNIVASCARAVSTDRSTLLARHGSYGEGGRGKESYDANNCKKRKAHGGEVLRSNKKIG
jgi:hypothetical protein